MKSSIMMTYSFFIFLVFVFMVVGNLDGVPTIANAKTDSRGEGEVHVVGGDQGWDADSDVASWALGRSFRVGDNIWFTYSAAEESIAELRSQEEYESCDITNPIRMYTGGLDKVQLDRQGPRYFVSSATDSCSKGLKLHVHVEPESELEPAAGMHEFTTVQAAAAVVGAAGPKPSGSVRIRPADSAVTMWVGLTVVCLMGFVHSV